MKAGNGKLQPTKSKSFANTAELKLYVKLAGFTSTTAALPHQRNWVAAARRQELLLCLAR